MNKKLRDMTENAADIGLVCGVLQGIALTPTLLPHQKQALEKAQEAIQRVWGRINRKHNKTTP